MRTSQMIMRCDMARRRRMIGSERVPQPQHAVTMLWLCLEKHLHAEGPSVARWGARAITAIFFSVLRAAVICSY